MKNGSDKPPADKTRTQLHRKNSAMSKKILSMNEEFTV